MKPTKLHIITCCLAAFFFSSCDQYLDVVPKGSDVLSTAEQYAMLFNDEDSHFYHSADIMFIPDDMWTHPEILTYGDIAAFTYSYGDPTAVDRMQAYSAESGTYYSCYERINKISNIIIDNIEIAKGSQSLKDQTIAEARALRAYNYFVLVNLYAKHYDPATASSDLCVPLWTTYDLATRPKQGTVAEIYKLIEDDLNQAIPNLSNTPVNTYHFSKAAGYALLAKVHLFKKEFDKAEEAALESYNLNHQIFDLIEYDNNNMSYIVYVDKNPEYLYYAYGEYGNSPGAISPELYSLFDAVNDIRFTGFFSFYSYMTGAYDGTTETQKADSHYSPGWDYSLPGAQNYFYNSAGLRTTDVILMLAECRARKGDFEGMKRYLDELRKKRIKGYVTASENPINWVEAVNVVINERRKELLVGFNRFWDLRRLNSEPEFSRTISRTAPANPDYTPMPQQTYTLAPDSYLWIVPLPFDELGPNYPELKLNVPY